MIKINFCEQVILNHALDHIVGWADNIVGDGAGLHFWIHDFVCFVFFIDNRDAGFFLKHSDYFRVKVFSPVVDNYLIITTDGSL